jgi:hypothetical protein
MDKSNRRRKVVIITDGDNVARQAAETAAAQVGGRCISRSAGNPTPLRGDEIIDMIKQWGTMLPGRLPRQPPPRSGEGASPGRRGIQWMKSSI